MYDNFLKWLLSEILQLALFSNHAIFCSCAIPLERHQMPEPPSYLSTSILPFLTFTTKDTGRLSSLLGLSLAPGLLFVYSFNLLCVCSHMCERASKHNMCNKHKPFQLLRPPRRAHFPGVGHIFR